VVDALAGQVVELHRGLANADIPHAFGGALALAFCTADPRGTSDIDVNVFVHPDGVEVTLAALPDGVRVTDADPQLAKRDGQVRLWWDETPVDLFFAYHPFHRAASERIVVVPFEGVEIPVLSCTDLAVFKALFARRRDWADIADMARASTIHGQEALQIVAGLLGDDSDNYAELEQALQPEEASDAYRRALGSPDQGPIG
jgi:hypothetical protein